MKRYIIAGLVLVAAVIGIAAATANYPTNVYDLPLSRMSRAFITNDGSTYVHPTLNTLVESYTFPSMPFAFAITEISERAVYYAGRGLYVEIDGVVNRVVFNNGLSGSSGSLPGASDCNNYVIKSPIFIPPGSVCKLLQFSNGQPATVPTLFIGGYALQPGEY